MTEEVPLPIATEENTEIPQKPEIIEEKTNVTEEIVPPLPIQTKVIVEKEIVEEKTNVFEETQETDKNAKIAENTEVEEKEKADPDFPKETDEFMPPPLVVENNTIVEEKEAKNEPVEVVTAPIPEPIHQPIAHQQQTRYHQFAPFLPPPPPLTPMQCMNYGYQQQMYYQPPPFSAQALHQRQMYPSVQPRYRLPPSMPTMPTITPPVLPPTLPPAINVNNNEMEKNKSVKKRKKSDGTPKRYECTICNRQFGGKQHYQYHVRTHSGEKPYKCPHCDKGFRAKHSLKNHIRIHTGERPYQCKSCGKWFRQLGVMKNHMRNMHNSGKK